MTTPPPLLADHPDGPDAALVHTRATVPGTAEEVYDAVATGPGIGTWFVPARVQEQVGGAVVMEHGPFGHSHGTVTVWDPPRRFAYEELEWGPDVPPWRTEIVVSPAGEDACEVVLTSGVTEDGGRWASSVAPTEDGWTGGLRNLRLARTHFPGQPAGGLFVVRAVRDGPEEAWTALLGALGLQGVALGDEVVGAAGAPLLTGVVEEVREASLLLRTVAPAPGLVELSVHVFQATSLVVRAHLYGPGGGVVAEAERPRWDAWLHGRFPGVRPA